MQEIISKELLSLVLNDKVISISTSERDAIENGYGTMHSNCILVLSISRCRMLNLDTLGRLCKEWCLGQGYSLLSSTQGRLYINSKLGISGYFDFLHTILRESELEAIIKATEWIANEKGLM